jgi:acyl dehydratase
VAESDAQRETAYGLGPFGHRTVTEAAIHAFASLTGDAARMHVDHDFGRSTPLGGPIAHGLLTAAWALGALTRHCSDPLATRDPETALAGLEVRFSRIVALGDTLCVRCGPSSTHALELPPPEAGRARSTAFEVENQRGERVSSGLVTVRPAADLEAGASGAVAPEPWPDPPASGATSGTIFHAEDVLERGPRGETLGQTLSETDVVAFARETGEQNPRYLNAEFARRTPCGERIASPMLTFCLGFAEFLDPLLALPMPDAGFAGHLGDSWRCLRPTRIGDTLRTRYRPLSCERSRSRPGQAIVHFGLQLVNQRGEIVQDGRVAMMIPSRPVASAERVAGARGGEGRS